MTKHKLVMWWSEDDSAVLVEVPELPGCMTDGATQQEALPTFRSSFRHGSRQRNR